MAKRKNKGKAQRRVKGWDVRFHAGQDPSVLAQRGQRHGPRAVKLPAERLEAPEENLEDLPKREALVVSLYQRGAAVRADGQEVLCAIAKTFRAPAGASALAVGDVVTFADAREHFTDGPTDLDKDRAGGFILARRPRQTALSRPRPMSAKRIDPYHTEAFEQVIAANMDQLLIVASTCQPALRPRLVERFLIVAERGELKPLLVVNKIDLAAPDEAVLEEFRALRLPVLACSATTGEGLEALRLHLAGKRSVLAGASGVGKSTLVNVLVPGAAAATREVRMKDERGRHTTAATSVYDLPAPKGAGAPAAQADARGAPPEDGAVATLPFGVGPGGILVDTPGMREVGFAIDPADLPWYFTEFEPFAPRCRFSNCTHTHEPDCAVQEAVEAGQIPLHRYESYLRMRDSLEDGAR